MYIYYHFSQPFSLYMQFLLIKTPSCWLWITPLIQNSYFSQDHACMNAETIFLPSHYFIELKWFDIPKETCSSVSNPLWSYMRLLKYILQQYAASCSDFWAAKPYHLKYYVCESFEYRQAAGSRFSVDQNI